MADFKHRKFESWMARAERIARIRKANNTPIEQCELIDFGIVSPLVKK